MNEGHPIIPHSKEKHFPFEFDSKRDVLFYPHRPSVHEGDILEVGPGRGDLLIAMAREVPQKKIIAVEIKRKRYLGLIPRLERNGIENVLLINGDARLILPRYYSENTFEAIFVLFPDPWPKKRHAFRRLLSLEFLWLMAHQLRPGGILIIASDIESYTDWARSILGTIYILVDDVNHLPHPSQPLKLPQTFFEQKGREAGRPINFLQYIKVGIPR